MAGAPGLQSFMDAIGQFESGNNYGAVGPNTGSRYGRARGRYQIMETIWSGWAREAGIPNADWRDPAAQDRVARHKMTQYYRQFGSWELVAIAWFAGPGRAQKAKDQGISSVAGIKDVLGTSVAKYASSIVSLMGEAAGPGEAQRPSSSPKDTTALARERTPRQSKAERAAPQTPWWQRPGELGMNDGPVYTIETEPIAPINEETGRPELTPEQQFKVDAEMNQESMAGILSAISQASRQRGRRELLDLKAFTQGRMFTAPAQEDQ